MIRAGAVAHTRQIGTWGQPPVVTSSTFRPWCDSYIQGAIDSCPLERPTTVYFSPTGSDASGNGTINAPYQTVAKANSILAESSGGVALLFARGGVFHSSVGLNIGVPAVTVGAYTPSGASPDLPKPVLTRFQPAISGNAWTETRSAGTYETTVTGTVSWLKFVSDSNTVLQQLASVTSVESTPGSWCQSGSTLYVHLLGGVSPSVGSRQLEYVDQNQVEGIVVGNVSDVRIDTVEIEGFGAGAPNDHSYDGYGIHSNQAGANRLVVTNCQVTYNGRHSIAKVCTGAGGSLVIVGCRLGWMANDNIVVVSESDLGGQELVCAHNTYLGGQLPSSVNPFIGQTGSTTDCHTGAASYTVGFMLCVANAIQPGQFQCTGVGSNDEAPTFSNLANCRSFVVDESSPARNPTQFDTAQTSASGGLNPQMGAPNTVYVGCSVTARQLWLTSTNCQILSTASGIWINSDFLFDFSYLPTPAAASSYAVQSTSLLTASFYNCSFEFRLAGGAAACGFNQTLLQNSSGTPGNGYLMNCAISCDDLGGHQFVPAWNNDGVHMLNNAYPENSVVTGLAGMNRDIYGAVTPVVPTLLETLLTGSESTPQPIMGYALQYDKLYHARTAQSARGAYEVPQT